MEDRSSLSVGDVLNQLLADRLIDACHMTKDHVTVVQGSKRHTFPSHRARTFLLEMLKGRTWADEDLSTDRGDLSPLRPVDTMREREGSGPNPLGPALDEMLRIASELDVIKAARRNTAAGLVTISLTVCETEMSETDAFAFLAECVLHKINDIRRLPSPAPSPATWKGGDGGWASAAGRPLD